MKFLAFQILILAMFANTAEANLMACYESEEDRTITPTIIGKLNKADELSDQLHAAARDHGVQEANYRTHLSHLRDHRSDLADVEKEIAKAKTGASEVPPKLFVALDSAVTNVKDFEKATAAAKDVVRATKKKMEALNQSLVQEWGKSLGWYVSESAADKKLSAESGFICGDGERQVAQLGIGMYTWGCLNSKGYMTKRAQRVIGLPEYYRDTKFVRDGDTLQQVIATDSKGQILSEKIVGAKEETVKVFSRGTLVSSLTSFGDAKTRAANMCSVKGMGMGFGIGMGHGMGMGAYGYGGVVSAMGMGGGIGIPASGVSESGAPTQSKPTSR